MLEISASDRAQFAARITEQLQAELPENLSYSTEGLEYSNSLSITGQLAIRGEGFDVSIQRTRNDASHRVVINSADRCYTLSGNEGDLLARVFIRGFENTPQGLAFLQLRNRSLQSQLLDILAAPSIMDTAGWQIERYRKEISFSKNFILENPQDAYQVRLERRVDAPIFDISPISYSASLIETSTSDQFRKPGATVVIDGPAAEAGFARAAKAYEQEQLRRSTSD